MFKINNFKIILIFIFLLAMCLFSAANAEPTNLKNVYIGPNNNIVVLSSDTQSNNLHIRKGFLSEPSRVFFDIQDATLSPSKQEIILENENIKNIKLAQYSAEPDIVRIVLYLTDNAKAKDLELIQYKGNFLLNTKKETPIASDYWLMTYYDKLSNEEEGSYFAFYKDVILKKEIPAEKPTETKAPEETSTTAPIAQETEKETTPILNDNEIIATAPTAEITPKPILKEKIAPLKLEIKPELKTKQDIEAIIQAKHSIQNPLNIIEDIQKVPDGFILKSTQPICVNRFFNLKEPKRLVLDINGNLSKKLLNQSKPIELINKDNVKIALFEEGTSRFVIDNTTSELDYKFILSPDSKSLVVTSNLEKVQAQYQNFFTPSELNFIHTNTIDDKSSEIIFDFSKPILHSFEKTDETFEIELYNVNEPNDQVLADLNKTKHFSKVKVFKDEEKNHIKISIPIKSTYKLQEFLGFDAKKLKITMNDIVYPLKEVKIPKNAKVIIDAGHGGKDQGASKGSILEKDITLAIAKNLDQKLKANKIKSILTREDDTYLQLEERTELANSSKADLFLSIHVNSCKKDDIKGVETHWFGTSTKGKNLAKLSQNNLVMELSTPDRGVIKSKFYVVHHTRMPAVLIETGFISNSEECSLINTKAYQEKIAKALEKAILLYLGYYYEQKQ